MAVKVTATQIQNKANLRSAGYRNRIIGLFKDVGYAHLTKDNRRTPCEQKHNIWERQVAALKEIHARLKTASEPMLPMLKMRFIACGFRFARQAIFCSLDRVWHRHEWRMGVGVGQCVPHPRVPQRESDMGHEYPILARMWEGRGILNLVDKYINDGSFAPDTRIEGYTVTQVRGLIAKLHEIVGFILKTSVIAPSMRWMNTNSVDREGHGDLNPYIAELNATFRQMCQEMKNKQLPFKRTKRVASVYENMEGACPANTKQAKKIIENLKLKK